MDISLRYAIRVVFKDFARVDHGEKSAIEHPKIFFALFSFPNNFFFQLTSASRLNYQTLATTISLADFRWHQLELNRYGSTTSCYLSLRQVF